MEDAVNSKVLGILSAAVLVLLVAGPASADAVNTNRPILLGDNGFEDNLQEVFDSITVGGPGIDAFADQTGFALFTNQASGGAVATFIVEITSGAGTQTIGLYDANAPSNLIEIFGASDTAGEQKLISFLANGQVKINGVVSGTLSSNTFGFYLQTGPDQTWYTEDSLNGGNPQALVYRGDGATTLQIDPFFPGLFSSDEYIFAFEDGSYANSDRDFQDAVFLVESITPVPEPGTAALMGLLGAGALMRRRRRKA